MKVSYNWLKEYTTITKTPEELDVILTDTGLEVESISKIEAVKGGLEGVVVGEVLSCEKHPDADKLKVTTVSIGAGEPLQIVCGAPNVAAGQKVIVATVGCTLYPTPEEPFKIKSSKIRGVESNGMLCAEDELGLGKSHAGILVLDDAVAIGTSAAAYFELEDDFEIDIGLTPNRADAMGHVGVVRDIIASLNFHENAGLKLNLPTVSDCIAKNEDTVMNISVENPEICPKYAGLTLKNIEVKPSPAWLQLRAVGLSPINNVVDATNYVMRELGTPLHAFDTSKLNGKIVVKTAKDGDKFTTLDGVERTLSSSNLMITNGTDNLCIAGVFGGLTSGITDNTTTVFLESAYFNPVSVRKTAKEHGLNTDASFRFERGVDPSLTEYALKRCASIILEIAGGEVGMSPVIVGEGIPLTTKVVYSFERCNQLIGAEIPKESQIAILQSLDIELLPEVNGIGQLQVPAYRVDVTREADIVEEVLRIYGFNKVPLPEKMNMSVGVFPKPDPEKVQTTISEFLVGKGFVETLNNSLTSSAYVEKMGGETLNHERNVQILNPLSQELDVMRQSLIFNILEVVEHNQNRQHPDVKLFEFGKTYHKFESGYSENRRLFIAISGRKNSENWNDSGETQSFYAIKGLVNVLFERLGLNTLIKESAVKKTDLLDGIQLGILKSKVGEIGWISSKLKKQFGIKNDVFVADLDWDVIIQSLKMTKIQYKELPKTFAVRRDFSLLLDTQVSFAQIEEVARSTDKKLLQEVGLFDVYEGKNLPDGKKSYAVSFKFQDASTTLKDQQIDAVMEKIRKGLEEKLGAELR